MSLLDTGITITRATSDLIEEEWRFILIDTGMRCVGYVQRERKSKRNKWLPLRRWDWYSERESYDRDSAGHPIEFKAENVPWSDDLVTEAKRLLMASLDKQIKPATQPVGQLT